MKEEEKHEMSTLGVWYPAVSSFMMRAKH